MSRIRKKLVVAVIGELVLTVLMQYIPQNIYAKSDKTVKTAFENYVSGTLVPMYGVLQTDTVESTKDYDWTAEDFRGLLSASVMDFDSFQIMIVIREKVFRICIWRCMNIRIQEK